MNQEQYKAWVGGLASLTQEQLADVQSRIKILSGTAEKETNGKSDTGTRLLHVVCTVMKNQGVETPSEYVLKKSTAYKQSLNKIQDVYKWLEKVSQSKLVQDAILKEGVRLLYVDLLEWGKSVSSHTILRQIHRIPASLNRAYPGYAASGILVRIVKYDEKF